MSQGEHVFQWLLVMAITMTLINKFIIVVGLTSHDILLINTQDPILVFNFQVSFNEPSR